MVFNFGKLKAAGISKSASRVVKLVKDRKVKTPSMAKITVLKDKILKPFNFAKFTKIIKLPKPTKIALIKKTIKAKKNVGF